MTALRGATAAAESRGYVEAAMDCATNEMIKHCKNITTRLPVRCI